MCTKTRIILFKDWLIEKDQIYNFSNEEECIVTSFTGTFSIFIYAALVYVFFFIVIFYAPYRRGASILFPQ